MQKKIYHGSTQIMNKPDLEKGKATNDYGKGFYCTEHKELAAEWASKIKDTIGYVNEYTIELDNLNILDLTSAKYNILNWITLLIKNRIFTINNPISQQAKDYLLANFDIDISKYDLIKGYRADDSYFAFAQDFLNNGISVQHLSKAMKLGKLGVQYVLISQKAFDVLEFIEAKKIDNNKYYVLHNKRDEEARKRYKESKVGLEIASNELYMLDIIRGEIKNGDSRL